MDIHQCMTSSRNVLHRLWIHKKTHMTDRLSLWHDTPIKQTIIDYVTTITDENSPNYVPPSERIATFDNDGTLWCEKPTYIQLMFVIERLRAIAEDDATLRDQPTYKAALEGDLAYFGSLYPGNIPALMQMVFDTHGNMTQAEFESQALQFLNEQHHPRFGVPYKQLTYKPMIELIRYLEANDFKVFIASAGGMSFVRTVSEEIYGIPRERVIGSNLAFETQMTDAGPVLYRKPQLIEPVDDGPGKPINIELHIGRKPIVTGGNATGDIEMLWYSETARYPSLQLIVNHDDANREYAYNYTDSKVLTLAKQRGWNIISMREDWRQVF